MTPSTAKTAHRFGEGAHGFAHVVQPEEHQAEAKYRDADTATMAGVSSGHEQREPDQKDDWGCYASTSVANE